MISEALELSVNGGRVSQSWCMCVVRHGYGVLGGGRDEGGGLYASGSHVWRCQITSRVRGNSMMTSITPPSKCAALCRVESVLSGLHEKALTRDAMR